MVVQHNLLAMNANRMLGLNNLSKAKSTEKLSSGYRINRAADDAAGLAISEKMRRMVRGLNQGAENTQDGISFVQIGDGAMEEINEIVNRITELSVKAANGTCTDEDRNYIDEEVQALKKEINRISDTTVFNEINVFDNHSVVFGLEGTPNDLQIFDATYDASGNLATYGGFLFHGERITWDMIDPNLVSTDAGTGKQVFHGGEYSYTSTNTGYSFSFYAKTGDVPPVITREISIEADSNGIILGKERFDWSKVYDLNGNTLSESTLNAGPWAVDYYGSKFTFTVPNTTTSLSELAKDVDSCKNASVSYNWEVYYAEGLYEQAVDVKKDTVDVTDTLGNHRVTQAAADFMSTSDKKGLEMTVRADSTGIWLQKQDGSQLTGSKKTWQNLGILSWDKGTAVPGWNGGSPVSYSYSDSATGLSFDFSLSDITSLDSVVDGLDGMKITGTPRRVQYTPEVEILTGAYNIKSANIYESIKLFFAYEDEKALGRDFDTKEWTTSSKKISYNSTDYVFTATFADNAELSTDKDDIVYGAKRDIISDITKYLDWVKDQKLAGKSIGLSEVNVYLNSNPPKLIEMMFPNDPPYMGIFKLQVEYNYTTLFTNPKKLPGHVRIEKYDASDSPVVGNCYLMNTDGSYTDMWQYKNDKLSAINNNASLSAVQKEQEKQQLENEINAKAKYYVKYTKLLSTDATTPTGVAESYLSDIFSDIADGITIKLTSKDYSGVDMDGEESPNLAKRPQYNAVMKETPRKPDIYIVHSGESNDVTGIYRYAMNTTALGMAFADCKTVESAEETLAATKRAQQYVAEKRSNYGAIQNRLEHTYRNNQNISENTAAAESRIRDTDMASEMVRFSNLNILQQAGQAMLAQANQNNQMVLSLLQ